MELDIWLGGQRVACTEERDRGRKVRIRYDEQATAGAEPETSLLSCSIPTPGPSTPSAARAFLEGLLPEGRALEAMAAAVRGVALADGAPETPRDVIALLGEYGRECAGAVALVPAGDLFMPGGGEYHPLSADDLADRIRALPSRPLGADPGANIRMSLAGAQPKLVLARFGDQWFEPIDGSATTHILKPTGRWPYSAQNEALVMSLAHEAELTPAVTWLEDIDGTAVLVTERYDRSVVGDRVIRSHQEDMCQALGIRPVDKYRLGRPSARMARLLRRLANEPDTAVDVLFRQVAFRVLVGDEDGHGKNYSVLLDNGRVSMAPLYDSLCTMVYPELSGRMGLCVGRRTDLASVDRHALLDEAAAMGIPIRHASGMLQDLADGLRRGLENLDDAITEGWPSRQVIDTVRSRIRRLESGQRLGETTGVGHARA
jgi:serine/threonine-protein kinase HipA